MDEQVEEAKGQLWSVSTAEAKVVLEGILIANSLAWSPDGATVYFADSPERRIIRYPYDAETGTLGPGSVHCDLADYEGVPDGSATDAEGGLWTAMFGGACVIRTLPSGEVDRVINLPVLQPTSCAFGGVDLTTLFVTTATVGMEQSDLVTYPSSGKLLSFGVEVSGLMPSSYAG